MKPCTSHFGFQEPPNAAMSSAERPQGTQYGREAMPLEPLILGRGGEGRGEGRGGEGRGGRRGGIINAEWVVTIYNLFWYY